MKVSMAAGSGWTREDTLLAVVIEDARWDGELGLRSDVRDALCASGSSTLVPTTAMCDEHTHLAVLPAIDEQQCTVPLRVVVCRIFKYKRHHCIYARRHVKRECRHEEANTWPARRHRRSGGPGRGIEARKVPACAFTEEPTFVEQAASLVGEAA